MENNNEFVEKVMQEKQEDIEKQDAKDKVRISLEQLKKLFRKEKE